MNTKIHEKISILEECKIKLKIKPRLMEPITKKPVRPKLEVKLLALWRTCGVTINIKIFILLKWRL